MIFHKQERKRVGVGKIQQFTNEKHEAKENKHSAKEQINSGITE